MLNGTVILAHGDALLTAGIERILTMNHPGVHVEKARSGREALILQSLMRADVVLMDENPADMPAMHLLQELRKDIVRPFVILCAAGKTERACDRTLRRGADCCVFPPVDMVRVCDLISESLAGRADEALNGGLPEMMLQRLFADNGIPCDLKGYMFLKYALALLNMGKGSLNSMRRLYEQIGERFGCGAGAVEHGIRYAVGLCMQRTGGEAAGNRQFIARLIEESGMSNMTMLKPRVSVFCSGRRVFR